MSHDPWTQHKLPQHVAVFLLDSAASEGGNPAEQREAAGPGDSLRSVNRDHQKLFLAFEFHEV